MEFTWPFFRCFIQVNHRISIFLSCLSSNIYFILTLSFRLLTQSPCGSRDRRASSTVGAPLPSDSPTRIKIVEDFEYSGCGFFAFCVSTRDNHSEFLRNQLYSGAKLLYDLVCPSLILYRSQKKNSVTNNYFCCMYISNKHTL